MTRLITLLLAIGAVFAALLVTPARAAVALSFDATNEESGTTSLFDRVANPLPIPN